MKYAALCRNCGNPLRDETEECPRCATATAGFSGPFPEIGGYQFLRLIGEGGMGSVYLAEDKALGRHVAIKMISDRFARKGDAAVRFRREARAMATVEHPHVVHVYAYGESAGKEYMVMEYVDGEPLSERVARLRSLALEDALRITQQVAQALDAAWEKHIVHRDIKPSNILLDRKNQVRVVDFGLAKPIEMRKQDTLTGEGSVLGTPHYVSPEQALGRQVDFRSDIYSLGIVLYEMLTGQKPFEGTTPFEIAMNHLSKPLPSIRDSRPDMPISVVNLVEWMTQKDSDKRPDSYAKLAQKIEEILAVRTPTPPSAFRTLQTHPLRHPLYKQAIGLLLLLLIPAATVLVWKALMKEKSAPVVELPEEKGLVVAIAPFYGPDEESSKEGRVMASFIERTLLDRPAKDVTVQGIDQTHSPVRDHEAARKLGERLGSTMVIWGEAYAIRTETEIQPYITMVPKKRRLQEMTWLQVSMGEEPLAALAQRSTRSMLWEAETPNQLELRKRSAEGIGEMVLLLAGMHALYREDKPHKALALLAEAPRTAESLYCRSRALLHLHKRAEAVDTLREAVALDEKHGQSWALLGDLYFGEGRFRDAVVAYTSALQSGSQFSTTRAIFHTGRIYAKETYRSSKYTKGKELETAYLLAFDQETGRILERYHLAGVIRSFSIRDGVLRIVYDTGLGLEREISFADGKFDRPAFYEEDPLLRLQSMRSGWLLAANFIGDLEKNYYWPQSRFQPHRGTLFDDAPKTPTELEAALREAISKDGTQPWHWFFLGELLWSTGNRQQAERIWEEMLHLPFPAIPYYDYSTMACFFERLGQRTWADKAYEEALRRTRRIPGSIEFTTLIERLVNANFVREAAWASQNGVDPERSYLWLNRARRLVGFSLEGDDFAAAAWAKYFEQRGEIEKSITEKEYLTKVQRHPLNIISAATRLDYAFYFLLPAFLGFLTLESILFFRAVSRSASGAGRRWTIRSVSMLVATVATGFFLWRQYWEACLVLAALFLFTAVSLRSRNVTLKNLVASYSRTERLALLLAFLVFVVALQISILQNHRLQRLLTRPLDIADSPGGVALVQDMEDRLSRNDVPEIKYAAAMLNHMSGFGERARELYQSFPDDQRAQENLQALENGIFDPPVPLSAVNLYQAYTYLSWTEWLRGFWSPGHSLNIFSTEAELEPEVNGAVDPFSFLIQFILLSSLALFVLFWFIGAKPKTDTATPENDPGSKVIRIAALFLPGVYDIRCGSPLRGYVTFLLFAFSFGALLVQRLIPHPFPVPGVVTLLQMPDYFNSIPFPTPSSLLDMNAIISYHYWTIFWTYPYSREFWVMVISAGVISVVLHVVVHTLSLRSKSPVLSSSARMKPERSTR